MKGSAALKTVADTGNGWTGFEPGEWQTSINVRDFIVRNVTPYTGNEDFLAGASQRTKAVWAKLQPYFADERKNGVLAVDVKTPSTLLAHKAGYIDRDNEVIVGLQTDQPFKRAIFPFGGLRMVEAGIKAAGFEPDAAVHETFTKYRKAHNDGVFDAYTPEIMSCRRSGIITGLPDAYGRGRIIGDYRRVALYGVDRLIEAKREERAQIDDMWPTDEIIRQREELADQIRALEDLAAMAKLYDRDISKPANNAQEAFQWTYFAYLGAIKEANGAAMSIGRISSFLDIYIERDLKAGALDEARAQELWDQLVQKLRIVRFLRTPDYDALFSGDPYWATECVGGMDLDGRALVTRSSYRMLHTLYNLGPAPEPNITVLWSRHMPAPFKRYCVKVSKDTSSLQYENDDLMRPYWGDDYAIACCVSAMKLGKQMQFFGARVNFAKALLYAINGGRDEVSGEQVAPKTMPVVGDFLDYDDVMAKFDTVMEWLARTYVHAMNCIHYMHDKYFYERLEMALHDRDVLRTMAFGIAGLSVVADSLAAIKYGKMRVTRDATGLIVDYQNEGNKSTPQFGNNDDRVDQIASSLVTSFMNKIRKHPTYRNATHTQSVLTITSNVVYGKVTGHTPDGRRKGEPFGPGANPMHGRDSHGWLASCLSVAKLPYKDSLDGISYTVSVAPQKAHLSETQLIEEAAKAFDVYFERGGFHMNLNVVDKETLEDAMKNPDKYPQLTIRVSGYAVNFVRLTPEQQRDVISRTFHGQI
ncbi:formate C-acetyltransferase [Bradyrhizobium jicamae]|uniref:Formate acetyltransferase n=1 Tax=Bradyrhizobium jicamae TaxID=280332 RepID=A0ABS5FE26_9BRAD|nr:formate C-acetyltransferase [Bradyrhizobium jicamae]MBR0795029.1 formate C-acetyltransferase [Bradyrhizobium jicamae]